MGGKKSLKKLPVLRVSGIQPVFESLQGWGVDNLRWQRVPAVYNSEGEKQMLDQARTTYQLFQLHYMCPLVSTAISSRLLSTRVLVCPGHVLAVPCDT